MDIQMLVNKQNPIDKYFIPENLVNTNTRYNVDRVDCNHIVYVVKEVFDAFQVLKTIALKEANIDLEIESAYRSYEYQQLVLDCEINTDGHDAYAYVALPGTSEHQIGLAIDFVYYENGEVIDKITGEEDGTKWVHNNCFNYGFILRYPKDKTEITGYKYEPWHLRYVEKELAIYLHNHNLTLEEYYFIGGK